MSIIADQMDIGKHISFKLFVYKSCCNLVFCWVVSVIGPFINIKMKQICSDEYEYIYNDSMYNTSGSEACQ